MVSYLRLATFIILGDHSYHIHRSLSRPLRRWGGGMVFMEWGLGVGESRVWVNMAMRDGVPN